MTTSYRGLLMKASQRELLEKASTEWAMFIMYHSWVDIKRAIQSTYLTINESQIFPFPSSIQQRTNKSCMLPSLLMQPQTEFIILLRIICLLKSNQFRHLLTIWTLIIRMILRRNPTFHILKNLRLCKRRLS